MCTSTLLFTTCHRCLRACLDLPLLPPALCSNQPYCRPRHFIVPQEGCHDICEMCRLREAWKEGNELHLLSRPKAPTHEVAEARLLTAEERDRAFQEQMIIVDNVKADLARETLEENHVAAVNGDLSFRNRVKSDDSSLAGVKQALQFLPEPPMIHAPTPRQPNDHLSHRDRVQVDDLSQSGVQQAYYLLQDEEQGPIILHKPLQGEEQPSIVLHQPHPQRLKPQLFVILKEEHEDYDNPMPQTPATTKSSHALDADVRSSSNDQRESRRVLERALSPMEEFDRSFGRGANISINF